MIGRLPEVMRCFTSSGRRERMSCPDVIAVNEITAKLGVAKGSIQCQYGFSRLAKKNVPSPPLGAMISPAIRVNIFFNRDFLGAGSASGLPEKVVLNLRYPDCTPSMVEYAMVGLKSIGLVFIIQ